MERRYVEHVQGSAKCKYTRSFPPKRLAIFWKMDSDLSTVRKIEKAIKQLTKHEKKRLIHTACSVQEVLRLLRD